MAATDDQVEALRAYLAAGCHAGTDAAASDAECQFLTLSKPDRLDKVGVLVYGIFAASRRRFSPTWTSAGIARFAAGFHSS
jgi:hypothetical protein